MYSVNVLCGRKIKLSKLIGTQKIKRDYKILGTELFTLMEFGFAFADSDYAFVLPSWRKKVFFFNLTRVHGYGIWGISEKP